MNSPFCCRRMAPALVAFFSFFAAIPMASANSLPSLYFEGPGFGTGGTYAFSTEDLVLGADRLTGQLLNPVSVPGASWITVEGLKYDLDPFIEGSISVMNLLSTPSTFVVTFTLPGTLGAPNLISGSIDTSVSGQDATLSAISGSSIYSALLDGTTVRTLQDDPFSLYTPDGTVSSSASFSWEPNNIPFTSMGIRLEFELSPGDSVNISSRFDAVSVPDVTATAGLLGIALAGVTFLKRRF